MFLNLFCKKEVKEIEDKESTKESIKEIHFFLDNYKILKNKNELFLKIIGILTISLVISIVLIFFVFINKPAPTYFAVTPDMKITKIVSLNEPYVIDNAVKGWLVRSINDTLALDFRNYEEVLLDSKKFFSEEAHKSLIDSIYKANIINVIKNKRIICTPIIQKAPKILDKGVVRGVYVWKMELEVSLSYEGSNGVELTQYMIADVIVQRTSTLENPEGVNIRRIEFKEIGAGKRG